jgi:hypothetical protein
MQLLQFLKINLLEFSLFMFLYHLKASNTKKNISKFVEMHTEFFPKFSNFKKTEFLTIKFPKKKNFPNCQKFHIFLYSINLSRIARLNTVVLVTAKLLKKSSKPCIPEFNVIKTHLNTNYNCVLSSNRIFGL